VRALSGAAALDERTSLRVEDPALTPSATVSLSIDGAPVAALEGETIAAALASADIANLGRRRDGTPRGLWCGMGVCQECIVTVDGIPSQRACMTKVADGMKVTTQHYTATLPETQSPIASGATPATSAPQVLIVGAGPAGLSAARAAALCGAAVVVVDERATPGGQYYKQIAPSHAVTDTGRVDAQARAGSALIAEVRRLGVEIVQNAVVWGAFGARELAIARDGREYVMTPERLVLATGAYERGVPLPGWTLAGYMTTGAAQTLLRAYRVAPGKRVLVAGNGPLNLQLAAELLAAGVGVVALVEAASAPGLRQFGTVLRAARAAPALVRNGLRYRKRLRSAGVPMLHESAVIAAEGQGRVEACTIARIDRSGLPVDGTSRRFEVDAVCVSHGFLPSNSIARALGCGHARDSVQGGLVTVVDDDCQTSISHVYAIGDGVRLMGAHVARHQGFVTGCAVAQSLGLAIPGSVNRERAFAARELRKHASFQKALWQLFAAPRVHHQLATAETVVCRCESVTRGTIERALCDGANTTGALKRRTRAGMGRCQGRYCEAILVQMLSEGGRDAGDESSSFAPRAPVIPIRISELV
jgi:NADPH-dependent 2,4-dienoyl-CoA reductase/sulfur reductase-like enzyme